MQRFVVVHDGSFQGWQTTYLAFHLATRLGAILQVLLLDSNNDQQKLDEITNHVEIGGRAAGLTIEIQPVLDFSPKTLRKNIGATDGLFAPRRLIPDGKSVAPFLEALSCPLWIVSKSSELHEMIVLVENSSRDNQLITYTTTLSQRIQQPITGLITEGEFAITSASQLSTFTWKSIPSLSSVDVFTALRQLNAGLLFISPVHAGMLKDLPCNCVIFPEAGNA